MRTALRTRLARLERRHAAPHPSDDFKTGMGISALLASCPDPEPDPSLEETPEELRWMRANRALLDRHCPIRTGKSLADCLANVRERIATARTLMAAETV